MTGCRYAGLPKLPGQEKKRKLFPIIAATCLLALHELREYRLTCVHSGLPSDLEARMLQVNSSR